MWCGDTMGLPTTARKRRILMRGSCLCLIFALDSVLAFVPAASPRVNGDRHQASRLFLASDAGDDGNEEIDLSDQDWRRFRAKLVMGEASSETDESVLVEDDDLDGIGALFTADEGRKLPEGMTPLDPSQWAYDSGTVIEQGAVILGGVEQDYGFGLRQQYFHKAAILVLDHQDSTFTKGIILNRPSDLTLDDDINKGVKWRVWFGGDVQALNSNNPDIVCLHTLKTSVVSKASVTVMNDIQWTSFDAAKQLVKAGAAKPTDFVVFCGYAGWGPGQLMSELERKSWYMVATDSQTLLKELARQAWDPREAGLDTWALLMNMIGRSKTAEEHTGDFDDLMLKEWALKNLLSSEAGGGAGQKPQGATGGLASSQDVQASNPVDRLIRRVSASSRGEDITEGTIVRASPADRSPFLLDNQDLHKSIVMVVSEDDQMTIGVILNRPGAKGLEVRVQEKESGNARQLKVPLRYGGQYSIKGSEPLLWLHCSPALKAAKIGTPVGSSKGIWRCTSSDMISAVGQALATPENFLVVSGVSVWTKGEKGLARGMQGEIRAGRFEVVPESKTRAIWDVVAKQEVLTDETLMKNLAIADEAWQKASRDANGLEKSGRNGGSDVVRIAGLGKGCDKEDDGLVFKSDVKVSQLSDDALRSWVATFLLGTPSLGD